jgi:hypothetical protein
VKGIDLGAPATGFWNEAPESSSRSYAGLDVISFDNFVPPRLKHFGSIDGEGHHNREGDGEGLTIFTDLPMPIREESIEPRSKTLRIIDFWGKSPEPRNSKPTADDENKGNTSKSGSRDLRLATISTDREMGRVQGESSFESGSRPDLTRSMLYNWHLLRMDNIRILDPQWESFRGSAHNYELLKLLAQTHEHQRWWLIVVDDFACPQCVDELRLQRMHPRVRRSTTRSIDDYKLTYINSP